MRKHFLKLLYALLPLLGLCTCGELDKLSEQTGIASFQIDSVYTASAQLGTPVIDDNTSTIEIPLIYGKYIANITFRAKVQIDPDANKLLNLNTDTICFATPTDEVTFYVVAHSGKARKWSIKLVDAPALGDNGNDILAMRILASEPANCLVGEDAIVLLNGINKYIKILVPRVSFPLIITPEMTLSEGAKLAQRTTTDTISFETSLSVPRIVVEAADGKQQTWQIYAEPGEAVYAANNDNYMPEQLRPVNIDPALQVAINGGAGNQLVETQIDSVANEITLLLRNTSAADGAPAYPFTATLNFPLRFNQALIGYKMSAPLTFDNATTHHSFYLFDSYNDLKKLWTVKTAMYKSNEADVTSFALIRSTPSVIKFDHTATEIDAEAATITLTVLEGKNDFPVQLRAQIGVSDKATLSGIESGTDFTMSDINATRTFYVRAEDGTEKQWTLRLVFAGVLNTKADVETFRVSEYHGASGKLVMNTTGIVDTINHRITLQLTNKSGDMPLRLKAAMTTSYKATFVDGVFTSADELVFANKNATKTFTLRSQDGLRTNTYTIVLQDLAPAENNAADLLTFRANNVASGYALSNTRIDQSTKTITLSITSKGSGLFSFVPQCTVSEGATLSGLTNGVQLSFASLTDAKTFRIISEDGSTNNTWTIKISYEPPIVNGSLDSWSGNAPTGWCTSNNSFATLVTSGVGQNGTKCAKMQASSVIGNFAGGSIFLGRFVMNLSQVSNPKSMSYFSIPFEGKPASISADVNYTSGAGTDMASIEIHVLNYSGSGEIDYHTYGSLNGSGQYVATEPGVTVIGYGRLEYTSTGGWVNKTVPVDYYYPNMAATHIHVAYCTSRYADQLRGDAGSLLYVDNIKLNY